MGKLTMLCMKWPSINVYITKQIILKIPDYIPAGQLWAKMTKAPAFKNLNFGIFKGPGG